MGVIDRPAAEERTTAGRRARFAWLTFGVIVTASTLVLGSLSARAWLDGSGAASVEVRHQLYRQPIDRIELDLGNGDATLIAGPARQVDIERRLRGHTKPTIEQTWQGNTLHIRVHCPQGRRWPPSNDHCAAAYTLQLPVDTVVNARTTSGSLNVFGIAGDLSLTTHSGDITLSNTTGAVRVRADSGSVTGGRLRSTDVNAQLKSGAARLTFVAAPRSVTAKTASGEIDIAVPEGRYRTHASTLSGAWKVAVISDDSATSEITAQAGSGDVKIHYGGQ
jgi:hypothetical protein